MRIRSLISIGHNAECSELVAEFMGRLYSPGYLATRWKLHAVVAAPGTGDGESDAASGAGEGEPDTASAAGEGGPDAVAVPEFR